MSKVVTKVVDGEELSLVVDRENFCEHCGELEPFEVAFDDDGCHWCLDCAKYSENFYFNFMQKDVDKANKVSLIKKIAYFEQRLHEWKKKLESME